MGDDVMKILSKFLLLVIFFNPNLSYAIKGLMQNNQTITPISPAAETKNVYLPLISNGVPGYFVSINGNDSNPGTFSQPWRTISKAARMVNEGDTVYIRGGIYNESVSFNVSGTESQLIRISAYPGENPVIDGGYNIPGYWGSLLNITGNYIHVSGIEVRNSAYMGVKVYGNYDLVDNIYVHHCKENGILITHGHHSRVENSRVWRNALANEYGQADDWSSGLSAARLGVSYATIRHNTVWENWGEGISSYEVTHVVIEDNIVYDNFSPNIYISDSTNVLCQRNFVYTNPESYLNNYGDHVGIAMGDERYTPASANVTVINNISFDNYVNYWWWQGVQGGGMNNVLIANNTFVNSIGRSGVIISDGPHQNVHFYNNLVNQEGSLPVILTFPNPQVLYSNNLWSKPPLESASGPGDVIGDPGLSKVGLPYFAEWFMLTNTSPAIGKALSLTEVLVDYFGHMRDSAPDIGAIEYIP
jgi:hypothetical protein